MTNRPETGSAARWTGLAVLIVLAVSSLTHAAFVFGTIIPLDGSIIGSDGGIAGGDFPVFYSAAVMAWTGQAGSVWEPAAFQGQLLEVFGMPLPGLNFFYPPVALLVWLPFAVLPYLPALWLWIALPLIALGWLILRLTGSWATVALTLISPLAIHNAGAGQTGAMFAAVLAAFVLLHKSNSTAAGATSSLLVAKPHLAFAIPICLIIDRNWRTLAVMAVASLILCTAVTALFGVQIWSSFLASVGHHSDEMFRSGVRVYDRSLSIVLLFLGLGAGAAVAWTAQVLVSLVALCLMILIWRNSDDPLHRSFALALAVCLLAPKVHHYDATILLVPISFVIARLVRGTAEMEFVVLAVAIWILPLVVPLFRVWGFNPGGVLLLAGLVLTFLKSRQPAKALHSAAEIEERSD